jgi:hypothetical protein
LKLKFAFCYCKKILEEEIPAKRVYGLTPYRGFESLSLH